MKLNFDVVVIGSGVAGMTAAIYLKRANTNVAIIEKGAPGGQINGTSKIENYPGFLSIEGPALAYNIFSQVQELEIPFVSGDVLQIVDKQDFKVIKMNKEEITCKAIIIATGRKPKKLGLENEMELAGRGVSWCAICDGPLFKGKDVVVVGGGNSALEESLYLDSVASSVTIVHRNKEFRGDEILRSQVLDTRSIKVFYNANVVKLNVSDNKLESVDVKKSETNEVVNIKAAGLFIYIGFEPVTDIVEDLNITNEEGYLIVDENMRTKIGNIYGCGDVIDKELYQVVTATGEGAKAAFSAIKDLSE